MTNEFFILNNYQASIINNISLYDKDTDILILYLNYIQDQIGFSYVCQKTNIIPHTLPHDKITGNFNLNIIYKKHDHGK